MSFWNYEHCKSITLKIIDRNNLYIIFKYKKDEIKKVKYNRNHIHKGFKLGEAIEYLIENKGKNREFFIDVSKIKSLHFGNYDFSQSDLIIQRIIDYFYKNNKNQEQNFTFKQSIPDIKKLIDCSQFWGEDKKFYNSSLYIGPNG